MHCLKNGVLTPTDPGIIEISTSYLILHKNDRVTVSAKLYLSNGTLSSSQPSFIWSSDNLDVASCTNGAVIPNAKGTAIITVTDGSHGFAFLNVSVVDDDVAIPANEPVSIKFNPIVSIIEDNKNTTINYTLLNAKGQPVSGTPIFQINENNSGITINNSTITTGSKTGLFTLSAKLNNNLLNGNLTVLVYDSSGNNNLDTSWHIVGWGLTKFPIVFNYSNKTAEPVIITYYELNYSQPGTFARARQTSPELLDISNQEIISSNGSGMLRSTQLNGGATIIAHFAGSTRQWYVANLFDLTGSWGGTSNGKSYNCCFYPKGSEVAYMTSRGIVGDAFMVGLFTENGYDFAPDRLYKIDYSLDACLAENISLSPYFIQTYKENGKNVNNYLSALNMMGGCTDLSSYAYYQVNLTSFNTLELNGGGRRFTLNRGSGDCSMPMPDTIQYIVIDGDSSVLSSNYLLDYFERNGDTCSLQLFDETEIGFGLAYLSTDGKLGSNRTLREFLTDGVWTGLSYSNCMVVFDFLGFPDVWFESKNNGTILYNNGIIKINGLFDKLNDSGDVIGTAQVRAKLKVNY
ncbi:MAG: hypothetical protein IPM95_06605 [Sphingobacteriales bacterium]|nr:hypothetical protein [Sphingobacteriales bacterium]